MTAKKQTVLNLIDRKKEIYEEFKEEMRNTHDEMALDVHDKYANRFGFITIQSSYMNYGENSSSGAYSIIINPKLSKREKEILLLCNSNLACESMLHHREILCAGKKQFRFFIYKLFILLFSKLEMALQRMFHI